MKIAYISNYLGQEFISKHANSASFTISGTLKSNGIAQALMSNGHEVHVFSTGITNCSKYIPSFHEIVKTKFGDFKVFYPRIFSFKKCAPINAIFLYFKLSLLKEKYDAVMFYNINENSIASIVAFKKTHKILEYEDNIFNNSSPIESKFFSNFRKKVLSYIILNTSNSAIVVAKNMIPKDFISNQFHFPGFINTTFSKYSTSIPVNFNKFKAIEPLRIYLTGGAHFSKGFDVVIDSLKYIPEIPIEIHLYSNTLISSEYLEKLNRLATNKEIIIHGFIPQDKLVEILIKNAHVLINTTRNMNMPKYTAGFPFKMLEYASLGIPIISSEIGMLETKFDSNICFYENDSPQELSKSLDKVYNDYENYQKKASDLKSYVMNNYTIDHIAPRMKTFLEKVND